MLAIISWSICSTAAGSCCASNVAEHDAVHGHCRHSVMGKAACLAASWGGRMMLQTRFTAYGSRDKQSIPVLRHSCNSYNDSSITCRGA
jgi:hypothetical protein